MSLPATLDPKKPTMLALKREYGWPSLVEIVTNIVVQLDVACGGDGNPRKCELWATGILGRPDVQGRSLSYLVCAMRDGVSEFTIHAKRLDLSQLHRMLNEQDQRIADNLSVDDERGEVELRDHVDRLQRNEESKDRKIARMAGHIEALKAKLSNDKPND